MLIPQIKLSELPRNAESLKALPSCEIVNEEGDYIGTLLIPSMIGGATIYEHIRTFSESLGQQSNSVLPPSVVERAMNPVKSNKEETIVVLPVPMFKRAYNRKKTATRISR